MNTYASIQYLADEWCINHPEQVSDGTWPHATDLPPGACPEDIRASIARITLKQLYRRQKAMQAYSNLLCDIPGCTRAAKLDSANGLCSQHSNYDAARESLPIQRDPITISPAPYQQSDRLWILAGGIGLVVSVALFVAGTVKWGEWIYRWCQ